MNNFYNTLALISLLGCSDSFYTSLTPLPNENEDTPTEEVPEETEVETEEPSETETEEPDTVEPFDPGDIEPTGLIGGVAQISYLWIPCADCFYGQVGNELAHSGAMFHSPTSMSWLDWLPDSGCITEDLYPEPPVTGYDLGPNLSMNSDGLSSFSLGRVYEDGKVKYRKEYLSSTLLYENVYFDVAIPQNNMWPAYEIDNAILTPSLFTHFQPSQILNPNFEDAYSSVLRRNLVNAFSWQPVGGDIFTILIEVYSWDGVDYLGGILCSEPDDGYLEIPAGAFAQYPYGSLAAVYAYKMQRSETIIPYNGSTLEGVGQYGVLGTAVVK